MRPRSLKALTGGLAVLSLCACLAAPVLYFLGRLPENRFKAGFLVASVGWFVFAIARGVIAQGSARAGGPGAHPSL
jgi:hypothetical protein